MCNTGTMFQCGHFNFIESCREGESSQRGQIELQVNTNLCAYLWYEGCGP